MEQQSNTPHNPKFGEYCRRGNRKHKIGGEEGCCEMSSGYDTVIVLRNSQQLGLPAEDLNKVKPVSTPALKGSSQSAKIFSIDGEFILF